MATPERVECPFCGTSYKVSHLKVKTGPQDKAIVRCACGEDLSVEFVHTPGEQTWWEWLRRAAPTALTVITPKITRYE